MTATVTELPRRRLRPLAPIDIEIKAQDAALALGGTGVLGRSSGPTKATTAAPVRFVADRCVSPTMSEGVGINVDCQSGCAPEPIVFELIQRGLFTCRDARRVG